MMETEIVSRSGSQVVSEPGSFFEERLTACVNNAFDAIGTSPIMEDYILCRLSLRPGDVVRSPRAFIESIEQFFGEAGASVYEYQLVRQIRREFALLHGNDSQLTIIGDRLPGDMLRAALIAAGLV